MNQSHPYGEEFFADIQATAKPSAEVVVPLVLNLVPARSVVDVGCGSGTWLSIFRTHGVSRVVGVDGDYVDRATLEIPASNFVACDLASGLDVQGGFDLAVCLEVAEHLPPARASGLVADLTRLAPVVLFSAAIPHQGGTGHVNERWPEYWADLFSVYGYEAVDCLRPLLWSDERVSWWYAQNCILYARSDVLYASANLQNVQRWPTGAPLRMVHPIRHLEWVHYAEQEAASRWA